MSMMSQSFQNHCTQNILRSLQCVCSCRVNASQAYHITFMLQSHTPYYCHLSKFLTLLVVVFTATIDLFIIKCLPLTLFGSTVHSSSAHLPDIPVSSSTVWSRFPSPYSPFTLTSVQCHCIAQRSGCGPKRKALTYRQSSGNVENVKRTLPSTTNLYHFNIFLTIFVDTVWQMINAHVIFTQLISS